MVGCILKKRTANLILTITVFLLTKRRRCLCPFDFFAVYFIDISPHTFIFPPSNLFENLKNDWYGGLRQPYLQRRRNCFIYRAQKVRPISKPFLAAFLLVFSFLNSVVFRPLLQTGFFKIQLVRSFKPLTAISSPFAFCYFSLSHLAVAYGALIFSFVLYTARFIQYIGIRPLKM